MAAVTTTPSPPGLRWTMRPLLLSIPLWIVALAYLGYLFVGASDQASLAAVDAVFPRSLLGIPMLEAFREEGRLGMHVFWGTPLVGLVLPIVISVVPVALRAAALAKHRR